MFYLKVKYKIKYSMKTLLHNFAGALRRFRLPTALNLIGMSVAFAVFLILMMQVTYEWGFDRFHQHADRLYRLEITHGESGAQACRLSECDGRT